MRSVRTLMTRSIDYAGLFPPARLDMAPAVRNYAAYREDEQEWALARFVLPVKRFEEFEQAAGELLPTGEDAEPWRISALIGEKLGTDLDAIDAFNRRRAEAESGRAIVDAIELKASTPAGVEQAVRKIPEDLEAYFELPLDGDPRGLVAALAGETNICAKARLGGVTPDAIPDAEKVARFIVACAAARVPWKATAGLHHAVRGEYPLTYEDDPPRGVMHGFLNVFTCAAMAHAALPTQEEAVSILTEQSKDAFRFDESGVDVGDRRVTFDQIAASRKNFLRSFGSCSFVEPIEDLQALGLL